MAMIWIAFVLLCIAVLVGAWCLMSATLSGSSGWRSMHDPTAGQITAACMAASALIVIAMGFAFVAFVRG